MTTETELRDLLESEAHGTVRASADWDDVVRRGAHHRRKARMRNGLVAGGLVVLAVVSLLSLRPQQPGRDQTTAAGPTTTTVLSQRPPPVPDLEVATAQGVSVTVVLDAATPEADFDPCTDQTVLVSESTSEVTLTIDQDGEVGGAEPWAACGSGPYISWGRVDLKDPLGTRTLIDASDGVPLTVLDGSPLLFPSWVPEPFDLARWNGSEVGVTSGADVDYGWGFTFATAPNSFLYIHNGAMGGGSCGGAPIDVRGEVGRLCENPAGSFTLVWTEDDTLHIVDLDAGGNDFTAADVLRIAEGLEPLG
ncbi:MAG TPA: hypothetical protein VMW08_16735 [Acidimicrobiales bacterium]|nr:hypothetical protein [Acidimicrobiales bacterium]